MTEQSTSNRPDYFVYHVKEKEGANQWIKLGAAWDNLDGEGVSIVMDALPFDFNGNLVIRKPKAQEEAFSQEV